MFNRCSWHLSQLPFWLPIQNSSISMRQVTTDTSPFPLPCTMQLAQQQVVPRANIPTMPHKNVLSCYFTGYFALICSLQSSWSIHSRSSFNAAPHKSLEVSWCVVLFIYSNLSNNVFISHDFKCFCWTIWWFPEIGVPANHPFWLGFPL